MDITAFILTNWAALLLGLMAFAKIIVNLTPTEADNMIFGYIDMLITAITGDRRKKRDK
jgi:hypothetical protein